MKTDYYSMPVPVFLQNVSTAVTRLKNLLQHDYEQAYPDLREIVHLVLDEEESNAWKLSLFPHLLLPDLVEAHIARLNLRPADTRHEDLSVSTPHRFNGFSINQPALALCG